MNAQVVDQVRRVAEAARAAARVLANASTALKDTALQAMAQGLRARGDQIRAANAQDVEEARAGGLSGALIDRLTLTDKRFEEMIASIEA